MQCPAQQYAYDTLREYPLEKWTKYRECVYLLELWDGNYVILLGKYGNAPMAYNSWVTKGCSDILFKLELELQISIIQENCETPKLEATKVSPRPLVSSFSP
tara:strand:+ start:1823 stop:2128 length:306 start_codon:yes stop_codon:yes gene_type:complete